MYEVRTDGEENHVYNKRDGIHLRLCSTVIYSCGSVYTFTDLEWAIKRHPHATTSVAEDGRVDPTI